VEKQTNPVKKDFNPVELAFSTGLDSVSRLLDFVSRLLVFSLPLLQKNEWREPSRLPPFSLMENLKKLGIVRCVYNVFIDVVVSAG